MQLDAASKRQKVLIYYIRTNTFTYILEPNSISWSALDNEQKINLIKSENWYRSKQRCEFAISKAISKI